jgi:hypothetical protein
VYEMIDVLRAGREMGSGKLMELTTRFYGLHLSDCESVADFSGQLSQINHTLRDLHPDTAFSEVQLILRFLQGLGSGYDTWISTLTQSSILIATSTSPAITFDAVCQKAYDEEKRQASMSGSSAALVAYSQSHSRSSKSGSSVVCTHCKKPNHGEPKCFIKYPHLKAEYDEKRRAKSKRKAENGGKGDSKKQKTDNPAVSTESGETAMVMVAADTMCIAIDDQVSGDLAPPPCEDQAFSAPPHTPLQNDWIIDTGCTNHATGTLAHFAEITYGDYGNCGGIGGSVRFEGIGTVKIPIPTPNGQVTNLNLTNVKYCPAMGPYNLISVSQLFKHKKGSPTLSEHSISWMIGKLKVNASARNGLWILDRAQ